MSIRIKRHRNIAWFGGLAVFSYTGMKHNNALEIPQVELVGFIKEVYTKPFQSPTLLVYLLILALHESIMPTAWKKGKGEHIYM